MSDASVQKWELIQRYPNTEYARWNGAFAAGQGKVPLATIEEMCRQWMKDERADPRPYFYLALAYQKHDSDSEKASTLMTQAINYFLQGNLRPIRDYSGQMTGILLPAAYQTLAEISLQRHDDGGALGAIKAAQALAGVNAVYSLYALEGKIWLELSNYARAESAYLEAWRLGSKEAEGFLKDLYRKKKGSLVGFEEYLTSKKDVATNTDGKLAPAFTVTSLDGKVFDSAALRGKVIVLNFWFIGCGPCRAEMPGLNRLVSEFSGKDVVFLAPTVDEAKELRAFLKEKRFAYQIIPAEKISTLFQSVVIAYPTHIVIRSL